MLARMSCGLLTAQYSVEPEVRTRDWLFCDLMASQLKKSICSSPVPNRSMKRCSSAIPSSSVRYMLMPSAISNVGRSAGIWSSQFGSVAGVAMS